MAMPNQDNKAVVRQFVDKVFVRGQTGAVDTLVAPEFHSHTWGQGGAGRAELKAAVARMDSALADVEFSIDDLIAEDDRVAARLTASARQVGPFLGQEPTGARYRIAEIHLFRLRDGKIVEHWHQYDQLGLMRQLGAMPAGARA